jgi:hypothetical protein
MIPGLSKGDSMSTSASSTAAAPARGKPLTAITVEKLKPRAERYEVGDPGARGLRLVVFPSGAKSFILRYRFGGRPKKLTIGAVELAAARKLAADAQFELARGNDPGAAKLAAKQEQKRAVLASEDSFRSVAERFLKLEGGKFRSADMLRKTLERLLYKTLAPRPIADIRRSEIVRVLDQIEEERGPVAAQTALGAFRRIANWYAARSDSYASPVIRGMARVSIKARARTRVLTDDEVRKVWEAAGNAGPFGYGVQICC